MRKRSKMSRKSSRKNFRKGAQGIRSVNMNQAPMRGGFRL